MSDFDRYNRNSNGSGSSRRGASGSSTGAGRHAADSSSRNRSAGSSNRAGKTPSASAGRGSAPRSSSTGANRRIPSTSIDAKNTGREGIRAPRSSRSKGRSSAGYDRELYARGSYGPARDSRYQRRDPRGRSYAYERDYDYEYDDRGASYGQQTPPPRNNGGGNDLFTTIWTFLKGFFSKLASLLGALAKRSKIAFAALVVVLLVCAIGVADSAVNFGSVYSRVSVGDVKARGMNEEELAKALEEHYSSRLSASDVIVYRSEEAMKDHAENPVDSGNLSVEEQAAQTNYWIANWEALQAHIDYKSLAHEAFQAGREGFFDRLGVFFFGRKVPVEVQFNDAALESLASNIDLALGNAYSNSEVTVENGKATASESKGGMMVDREKFREKLSEKFTDADVKNREFFETVTETEPQITTEEGQAAADKVNAAIANGAEFVYDNTSWTVDANELGSWVGTHIVTDKNGDADLVPYFDPKKASTDISEHAKAIFPDGEQAVRFEDKGNGNIVVKLESEGTMPQINSSVSRLNDQLLGDNAKTDSQPTVQVDSVKVPSEMSFNEALNANVIGVISEYTTEFTAGAAERNHNIMLAGDKMNNGIVPADGGVWSFHEQVGESNAENGFQSAGSIVAGEMSEEIGGGICLVATTVFNAVYDSGLPVIERRNHTMYISSYPEGRDAAVSWPDLDLKWENDTSSDILVKTSHTDTSLTVCLYGVSPGYTVETETGEWTDSTEYDKVVKYDSEVAPGTSYIKTSGANGHSITVTRTVKDKKGEVVREDTFESVYDPTDEVTVRGGTSADWPSN